MIQRYEAFAKQYPSNRNGVTPNSTPPSNKQKYKQIRLGMTNVTLFLTIQSADRSLPWCFVVILWNCLESAGISF